MDFITTREELRSIYKLPSEIAVRKELSALDAHSVSFIGRSPFLLMGTFDGDGRADVTPRGDRPGFVAVLDPTTIAIPDRPGNNRLDTLDNLIANPSVGLLFLIPGMNETLRVNGTGRITTDETLRTRLAVEGKLPQSVVVVSIEAVYMHCAKAFMRSELWNPGSWPDRTTLPTLGQILRDQMAVSESPDATDRRLDEAYRNTMW